MAVTINEMKNQRKQCLFFFKQQLQQQQNKEQKKQIKLTKQNTFRGYFTHTHTLTYISVYLHAIRKREHTHTQRFIS